MVTKHDFIHYVYININLKYKNLLEVIIIVFKYFFKINKKYKQYISGNTAKMTNNSFKKIFIYTYNTKCNGLGMNKIIIEQITIKNFRNIKELHIEFDENKNEILGANGTGKSSILDAILYVLFLKNYDNKKTKNIRYINENSQQSNIAPEIELILRKNGNSLMKVSTKNERWFINNIEQKNQTTYQESLSEELNNVDLDALFVKVCPITLFDTFSGERSDKKELRNSIITVINALNSNEDKIDESELEDILFDIKDKEEKRKRIQNQVKEKESDIDKFKLMNPEIKSWIIDDTNKEELLLNKKNIDLKIDRFNSIANIIEKFLYEERELNIETRELEKELEMYSPKSSETNYSKSQPKKSILSRIFYFFFGWIIKIFKRNKNEKNDIRESDTNDENINSEIRLKKDIINRNTNKISCINDEMNKMKFSPDYRDVDVHELKNQRDIYANKISDKDANQEQIIKILDKEKELKNLKNESQEIDESLIMLNSKKREVTKKINYILKRSFKNFDIDLFKDDEKEKITIKYKGIDWEHLNRSKKLNIIYEISTLLQNKIGMYPFVLIDNAEAINKLFDHENNQTIVAKVTNDMELKINGKNIYKNY